MRMITLEAMSLRNVLASGAKVSPPGWLPDNLSHGSR